MSKVLAKLIGEPEKEVASAVAKLEAICGFPSEDVRLLAENKHKIRTKVSQLGLDPDDTTDEELYYALLTRFEKDSQTLDKALGVTIATKFDERLSKVVQLVNHCACADEVWAIKNPIIRATLLRHKPKQVAKKLHYRSVASMIKREDLAEIYLAGLIVESATWQKNVTKSLAKLSAAQYELRPVKIVTLRAQDWGSIRGPSSHIVFDRRLGAVAVWPSKKLWNASVLTIMLLMLESIRLLNPGGYSETLHELSPALRWWADTENLISDGELPISLNIRDVVHNHLKNHQLHEAIRHHGSRSLWDHLMSRYYKISESLADKIPNIQINFSQNDEFRLPTSSELAEEYAEAD